MSNLDTIYKYFTIVATNSVHILVSNSPKQLCNWDIDICVTMTLTMITPQLNCGLYFYNIAALEKTNCPSLIPVIEDSTVRKNVNFPHFSKPTHPTRKVHEKRTWSKNHF